MVFAAAKYSKLNGKHTHVFIIEPKHYLLPNNKALQSLDLQIYLPQYLSGQAAGRSMNIPNNITCTGSAARALSAHGGVSMIYAQVLLSFESERARGYLDSHNLRSPGETQFTSARGVQHH
jgi:hypothetical protein